MARFTFIDQFALERWEWGPKEKLISSEHGFKRKINPEI